MVLKKSLKSRFSKYFNLVALTSATLLLSLVTSIAPAAAVACPYQVVNTYPARTATISATPTPTTQVSVTGDVLAGAAIKVGTAHLLAIGGNFTYLRTTDGVQHSANNFAVINQLTGQVVYTANVNSYVRTIAVNGSMIYFGGDFTQVNGTTRYYIAAVNAANWSLSNFNPGKSNMVRNRAIATFGDRVYFGGDGSNLYSVTTNGMPVWTDPVWGGSIKTLLTSPDGSGLFVGGLFEQVSTLKQHGLMEVFPSRTSGTPYPKFAPKLRTDVPYWSDSGDEALSLAWDTSFKTPRLILGAGGATINSVHSIDPSNGVGYGPGIHTEGDAQGVAVLTVPGKTPSYIVGYHRNHGNGTGCPYNYYGEALTQNLSLVKSWNPRLGGEKGNADGGNSGIQAIVYDPSTRQLFLLGAFFNYGGTCVPHAGCSGGSNSYSGIARFSVY